MTYAVSLGFGSGYLYMTPASGTAAPIRVGVLQDVSVDISFEEKLLYGQNQWAQALARGKAKGACKAKFAQIDSLAIGTLFLGGTPAAGQNAIADLEAHPIPTTPYQVTVTPPNSGTFESDKGVFFAATAQPFAKVANSPTTGQYSVAGAVYTFAAADTGVAVLISYEYTLTTGNITAIANQPLGTVSYFQVDLYQGNPEVSGGQWGMRLYRCASTKLNLATKQDDWMIPEFDFSIQANAAGKVLDFNSPN